MKQLLAQWLLTGAALCSSVLLAQDYDALIQQALRQRDAGDLAAAEQSLRSALALPSDKSEVLYLLGMVVAFQNRYDEALTLIDQGLRDYPDNAELKEARARVLFFRSGNTQVQTGADGKVLAHQLTTGFARSSLDLPGFADWSDRFVEYRHIDANGNQQYLRAEHNHRFDRHDTQYEGGLALNRQGSVPFGFAVGFTPSDDFMPEYFARADARTTLVDGSGGQGALALTGLFQYSSFANGNTKRVALGLEYYLPNVDAWLTPGIGLVRDQDGQDTFAWNLGAHWQVGGNTRVGATFSDAPETENLLTIDSKSYSVYLRQQLSDDWLLFVTLSRFDRQRSYTRDAIDVALQWRF